MKSYFPSESQRAKPPGKLLSLSDAEFRTPAGRALLQLLD